MESNGRESQRHSGDHRRADRVRHGAGRQVRRRTGEARGRISRVSRGFLKRSETDTQKLPMPPRNWPLRSNRATIKTRPRKSAGCSRPAAPATTTFATQTTREDGVGASTPVVGVTNRRRCGPGLELSRGRFRRGGSAPGCSVLPAHYPRLQARAKHRYQRWFGMASTCFLPRAAAAATPTSRTMVHFSRAGACSKHRSGSSTLPTSRRTPRTESAAGRWPSSPARSVPAPDLVDANYYPVFPYPSYTGMLRDDVAALHAYLLQTPPVAQPSRAHQLPWYMGFRIVNWAWKLLFLKPGPYQPVPGRSQSWNRGAYLVTALTHCGECHTPRNPFGRLTPTCNWRGLWTARKIR